MNSLMKATAVILPVVVMLMGGCSTKDNDAFDQVAQFDKEVAAIDDYLSANNIAHEKDPSGVRIVPTVLGSKLPAQAGSIVEVDYKGSLFSNGQVFEQSTTTGALTRYIVGWQIALRKLPVGSMATIYIPSYYGYGPTATSTIPANSTLVFDITIKSASQSTVYKEKFTADTTAIRKYLNDKSIQATKDPTGVFYINQLEGTGATPDWFDQVTFKYSFTLFSDDTKSVGTFDRGPNDTFASFVVDHLQGVQVALRKMKVGGKMRLFVPSGLAFGIDNATDGSSVIVPANSNVIVDIELLGVN